MITLHPAFDPHTRTWFIEGYKKEAKTLAALQAIFHRAHLEGYFPQGYTASRPKGGPERTYLPIKSHFHIKPAAKHKTPTSPVVQQSYNAPSRDLILNDWAAGMSAEAIANKYNVPETNQVTRIIVKARAIGDSRAAKHIKLDIKNERKKRFDHDAILDLWAKGIDGPEIGRRLGLTRATTASGIVALYRKKGDPRAVVRNPVRIKNAQSQSSSKSSLLTDPEL